MSRKTIAVLGAGGCAREVAWTIRSVEGPGFEFIGYIVSDLTQLGERDARDEVLGTLEWLEEHSARVDALAVGIGNPSVRRSLVTEALRRVPHVEWPAVIHRSAQIDLPSASIGRGVVVCANAVATVNITLGDFSMVHYGATIGHESSIGCFSVVNPGANISGGVRVGDAAMVGAGAVIRQYLSVGHGATIGAGAVVTRDVPSAETWIGVPATPMRASSLR